jgi:hypothetical protein
MNLIAAIQDARSICRPDVSDLLVCMAGRNARAGSVGARAVGGFVEPVTRIVVSGNVLAPRGIAQDAAHAKFVVGDNNMAKPSPPGRHMVI